MEGMPECQLKVRGDSLAFRCPSTPRSNVSVGFLTRWTFKRSCFLINVSMSTSVLSFLWMSANNHERIQN
jgi:hypothetical protein